MIEHLNKKGTLRLIFAMRQQAERDVKCYGKKKASKAGSAFISQNSYETARYYLDVELPVIREVLGESFKD